jgi:transcription termination factor NusB
LFDETIHTRWSQVLQNRHVIFVWCSVHLILSRITFRSTSSEAKCESLFDETITTIKKRETKLIDGITKHSQKLQNEIPFYILKWYF